MIHTLQKYVRKTHNALWEYRLNIQTWGMHKDPSQPYECGYETLAYSAMWALFDKVRPTSNDVFVDIGCGKGRAVCCAARFPLRKVIGVEINPEFARIARRNADRLNGGRSPIQILNSPAEQADLSEGTVFYLFNPFGEETLRKVLKNFRNDRPVRMVYVNPRHESVMVESGWLHREDHWPPRPDIGLGQPVSFWTSSR